MSDRQTLLDLIPAYALDVLDAGEKQDLERLLAHDEEARRLLSEYRQVGAVIALSAPWRQPPPELEAKLRRRFHRRRLRRLLRVPLAAAAVMALSLFALWWLLPADSPAPELTAQQVYERLRTNPQGQRLAVVPLLAPEIEGDLVFLPDEKSAVLRLANMPPLAPDQTYQLWLVDADGPMSGGIFPLTAATAYIELPITKPVRDYVRFGMSLEPRRGSPLVNRPSGPGVLTVPLSSP